MKVKRLPLRAKDGTVRAYTLVDEADYPVLCDLRWSLTSNGYVVARGVLLHRLLLGLEKGDELEGDHINRDRLDNRRSNLRVVSLGVNRQNMPARGGSSAHRGVGWDRQAKRWRAYAQINGRQHHIGLFVNEQDAASAAREFRAIHMPGAVD